MNATLCITTEMEQCKLTVDTDELENVYATAPMAAIRPLQPQYTEEELHTSFEHALSVRMQSSHLGRVSNPSLIAQAARRRTSDLNKTRPMKAVQSQKCSLNAKKIAMFFSLAMMFMMIGFDMMGLLVMHMH